MLHRDAFNSLMNEDQHALACMRNNVIAEMKKRSHKSAESLLQKANRRKHMLITELLYSAASGDVQSIHDLLTDATSGIELSIDDGDYDGRRALHVAASEGQYAVVRSLVDHRADVNVVDRFNNTPCVTSARHRSAALPAHTDAPLTHGARSPVEQPSRRRPLGRRGDHRSPQE